VWHAWQKGFPRGGHIVDSEVALDHRNAEIMPAIEVPDQDEAERPPGQAHFIDKSNQSVDNSK
jgi:hypothetical protein